MSVVRPYAPTDEESVVELSLDAWTPVFASMQDVLGEVIYSMIYPDWRTQQYQAVQEVLRNPENTSWVSGPPGSATGFVSVTIHQTRTGQWGEILMLAVSPAHQRPGVGLALTTTSLQ